MMVDGARYHIATWLSQNEALWYEEWDRWRRAIALCSKGDFHWTDRLDETLAYHNNRGAWN